MTFHLRDRVVFTEIVGDSICQFSGFISGITTETEPRYDVTLDAPDAFGKVQVATGIKLGQLRPERVTLGDEV